MTRSFLAATRTPAAAVVVLPRRRRERPMGSRPHGARELYGELGAEIGSMRPVAAGSSAGDARSKASVKK